MSQSPTPIRQHLAAYEMLPAVKREAEYFLTRSTGQPLVLALTGKMFVTLSALAAIQSLKCGFVTCHSGFVSSRCETKPPASGISVQESYKELFRTEPPAPDFDSSGTRIGGNEVYSHTL